MFKHMLVPLDGSERAGQALPVAARIARAGGGMVSLLRVVDVQEWYGPYFVPTGGLLPPGGWTPSSGANQEHEVAEAYLNGTAAAPELLSVQMTVTVREGTAAN